MKNKTFTDEEFSKLPSWNSNIKLDKGLILMVYNLFKICKESGLMDQKVEVKNAGDFNGLLFQLLRLLGSGLANPKGRNIIRENFKDIFGED